MRTERLSLPVLMALLGLWAVSSCPAKDAEDDLFYAKSATTDAGPQISEIIGSDHSISTLIRDASKKSGKFDVFVGRSFDANFSYAGVKNAIKLSVDASGDTITLNIPITGFVKSFKSVGNKSAYDQLKDFLKHDASEAFEDFQKAINKLCAVAVTDGNPAASTAIHNNHAFFRYSVEPIRTEEERIITPALDDWKWNGSWSFDIGAQGQVSEAHGFDATSLYVPIGITYRFTDRIALDFSPYLSYRQVEDADIYQGGATLGVPIKVLRQYDKEGMPVSLKVTPYIGLIASGSIDFIAGGVTGNGGLGTVLSREMGNWTFQLGNQIAAYEGVTVPIAGYEINPGVSQQIYKTSGGVGYAFAKMWYVDGSFGYSTFLQDAAVEDWISLSPGIGARLGEDVNVRLAFRWDYGIDGLYYESKGIDFSGLVKF